MDCSARLPHSGFLAHITPHALFTFYGARCMWISGCPTPLVHTLLKYMGWMGRTLTQIILVETWRVQGRGRIWFRICTGSGFGLARLPAKATPTCLS